MDSNRLDRLKRWFDDYCRSFYVKDEGDQRNIRLKEEHTHNVCANALRIARELSLGGRDILLAETVALFHDVGRFPQYREYKTYRDSVSVNHAALGAKVLLEQNVLQDLPRQEQDLIVRAVTLHNVFTVPGGLDNGSLLHLKLVRDADKLDIWRVFQEYFVKDPAGRASAAGLGLPDTPDFSPGILTFLQNRQMVKLAQLRTLNDFKLLQLAWIYDLNFTPSLRMVAERNIITMLGATLPESDDIRLSLDVIREYVNEKIGSPAP